MKEQILAQLSAECPWRDTLYWFESIDSTNTKAKELARQGASHGTVLIAGQQTGGRGRRGRNFSSPAGMGVYLSVILRPACPAHELMHLTCAAGVAMCEAVKNAAGFTPGIKWINDLVTDRRKLGGILTELSADPKTGLVDYAVIGIGINCTQKASDFPAELQTMAASVSMYAPQPVSPSALAAAMIESLVKMNDALFSQKALLMERYRKLCVTIGQDVQLLRADRIRYGKALDMDDDGGLIVVFDDGSRETVNSGEVSVRGLYGYI